MQRFLHLVFLLRLFQAEWEFDLLNGESHGKLPNSILGTQGQDAPDNLSWFLLNCLLGKPSHAAAVAMPMLMLLSSRVYLSHQFPSTNQWLSLVEDTHSSLTWDLCVLLGTWTNPLATARLPRETPNLCLFSQPLWWKLTFFLQLQSAPFWPI